LCLDAVSWPGWIILSLNNRRLPACNSTSIPYHGASRFGYTRSFCLARLSSWWEPSLGTCSFCGTLTPSTGANRDVALRRLGEVRHRRLPQGSLGPLASLRAVCVHGKWRRCLGTRPPISGPRTAPRMWKGQCRMIPSPYFRTAVSCPGRIHLPTAGTTPPSPGRQHILSPRAEERREMLRTGTGVPTRGVLCLPADSGGPRDHPVLHKCEVEGADRKLAVLMTTPTASWEWGHNLNGSL